MQDFFLSTGDDGFVTLTYYTSGARSFYTKDRAIRTPADLKGLKIRVQDMKSQTDMMSYLGGIPGRHVLRRRLHLAADRHH